MSPALPAALVAELSALLGAEGWRMDDSALEANAQDNSWRRQRPAAVALPADVEQVQALVRACRAHGVALVARGAGTGTTGAAVPQPGSIVLSFTRMDRIVEIRAGDRCAVVQPGVLNGTLQQALAPHGLFWAPDPSSAEICSIGGNLACNAGGPRAVKYGTSRDNVLGLVAVTGTGEVIRCGGAYTKDATGYDLTHLLVGSEGTLALIVEATLKLTPLPVSQAGLRVLYRDADAAAAAVSRLMSQPVVPTRLEFMDARSLELLRLNGADVPEAGAMLLVEADGDHDTLPYLLQALASAAEGDGMIELDVAMEGRARDQLWAARKALSPALRSVAPGKINEDVVVPVSRIPELVAGVQALARDYADHRHLRPCRQRQPARQHPLPPGRCRRERTRACRAAKDLRADAGMGGTLSGEHGIGLAKRDFMAQAFTPETLATMRAIKAALDPDGILNPGKVLPPA
jgi:D-lactate dehydrogenase